MEIFMNANSIKCLRIFQNFNHVNQLNIKDEMKVIIIILMHVS